MSPHLTSPFHPEAQDERGSVRVVRKSLVNVATDGGVRFPCPSAGVFLTVWADAMHMASGQRDSHFVQQEVVHRLAA